MATELQLDLLSLSKSRASGLRRGREVGCIHEDWEIRVQKQAGLWPLALGYGVLHSEETGLEA